MQTEQLTASKTDLSRIFRCWVYLHHWLSGLLSHKGRLPNEALLTVTQFRGGIHDLRRGGLRLVHESSFLICEAKVESVMYNIPSLYP